MPLRRAAAFTLIAGFACVLICIIRLRLQQVRPSATAPHIHTAMPGRAAIGAAESSPDPTPAIKKRQAFDPDFRKYAGQFRHSVMWPAFRDRVVDDRFGVALKRMHLSPEMETKIHALLAEQIESETDAHEVSAQRGLGTQESGAAILAVQSEIAGEVKAIAGDAVYAQLLRADEIAPVKTLIRSNLGLMIPGDNSGPYSPEQLDALAGAYYDARRNSGGAAPWDPAVTPPGLNSYYQQIAQSWQAIVGPSAMSPLLKMLSAQQTSIQKLKAQFGR